MPYLEKLQQFAVVRPRCGWALVAVELEVTGDDSCGNVEGWINRVSMPPYLPLINPSVSTSLQAPLCPTWPSFRLSGLFFVNSGPLHLTTLCCISLGIPHS